MDIELQTADGSLVHQSTIPPFDKPPTVIGWGDRVFVAQHIRAGLTHWNLDTKGVQDGVVIYHEAFAYALPG